MKDLCVNIVMSDRVNFLQEYEKSLEEYENSLVEDDLIWEEYEGINLRKSAK